MTTLTTVNKILESFPLHGLSPIVGEPYYQSITKLHRSLKANAASVPTALDVGLIGHLALVLSPKDYATISADAFPALPTPGATFVAPAGTSAQISVAEHIFNEALHFWNQYQNTDRALKL
jgi:hypothetical protein